MPIESVGSKSDFWNKAVVFFFFQLDININPDKGWKTEDMFVPPGFHIDAEITGEDEKPDGEIGDQPFSYPMGVGGMIMNGCFGKEYQPGDPCFQAKGRTTICLVGKLCKMFCKREHFGSYIVYCLLPMIIYWRGCSLCKTQGRLIVSSENKI